ncbi:MAG TPA: ATP-dependent DNA helicase RecG [Thermoanaerobaculia bacterium]|nr:ATP-dependent DNA helicase RecG [Thermoanaerobaculia bacterium]
MTRPPAAQRGEAPEPSGTRAAAVGPGTAVTALPGVGPRRAATLAAAGIERVGELLWHLPRDWQDRRRTVPLSAVTAGGPWLVRGRLERLRLRRLPGRGRCVVEAVVRDASGALPVSWFHQPWLAERLAGGGELLLRGRAVRRGGALRLEHPQWEAVAAEGGAGGLLPVYPPIGGCGSSLLRGWLAAALAAGAADALDEPLAEELRLRHRLPPLGEALRSLHQPPADTELAALRSWSDPAHGRLVYGELLAHQLELAQRARAQRDRRKPHRYRLDDAVRRRAREVLPFRLTGAQKRVVRELVADLERRWPMRRLLQGDVGSGKTLVAALLLLLAAESGLQGALLAPTEILAEQHAATLGRLLGRFHRVELLTAGSGAEARRAVARGAAVLAVGTHALFQQGQDFHRLALVVIDEQHRFGVRQRELMTGKGPDPDVLVMSATPIPRSLALTAYGDLDLAVLDELPPGRHPVETLVLPSARRREAYRRLRQELAAGGRGYVVFPAIAEGEERGGASLAGVGRAIRQSFAEVPSAELHGRMDAATREAVMESFRRGEVRLLLATTVIEVGVDVPEASAMIVESAERFGLGQLHQLRGRVGRGERPAWCAALHGPLTPLGRRRLAVFAGEQDGFALAEADLALRGPGDLLGERQAGELPFRFAQLPRDGEWLERARGDAREIAWKGAGSRSPPL